MRILAINSFPYGSTGNIMMQVLDCAQENLGAEVVAYFGAWRQNESKHPKLLRYGSNFENRISFAFSYFTGFHNVASYFGTQSLIRKIKKFQPDIIHLHNLHFWNINLPLLFRFLKKNSAKVVWTLHDCWSFTGQCPHFTIAKCEKWKTGCHSCPNYRGYPNAVVDNTRRMYALKKKWFTGVPNMTIVAPSQWLANLVKESFLAEYPVKVIHNGIDLSVFQPTENSVRETYAIPYSRKIVLGVSFGWGHRKGLDVFLELARRLDKEKYQIILVGTTEETDKVLPENIISIHRTHNQQELAALYSAADIFVNPTREETLGMVNIEALACGTPVITFNTGGSPETLDEHSGMIVPCDDVDGLTAAIMKACEENTFSQEKCIARAQQFNSKNKFLEYTELFTSL